MYIIVFTWCLRLRVILSQGNSNWGDDAWDLIILSFGGVSILGTLCWGGRDGLLVVGGILGRNKQQTSTGRLRSCESSAGDRSCAAGLKSASFRSNLLARRVAAIAGLVLINQSEFICSSLSWNKSLYSNRREKKSHCYSVNKSPLVLKSLNLTRSLKKSSWEAKSRRESKRHAGTKCIK